MRKIILALAISLSIATPALAMKHFLTRSWFANGAQMCQYSDGTVLNMGARVCPLSIGG